MLLCFKYPLIGLKKKCFEMVNIENKTKHRHLVLLRYVYLYLPLSPVILFYNRLKQQMNKFKIHKKHERIILNMK
jgi:hypothetical protein